MIKANELRIGNIIEVDGRYITISHLKEKHFCWVIKDTEQGQKIYNPYLPYTDDRVKPIPLTEELLLKCGFINEFEDEEDNSYFTLKNIEIQKILFKEEFYLDNVNNMSVSIKNLHQLQNLYFALTGTELEINL